MKLTVIIEDSGALIHIGSAMGYRRVTLELTPEQAGALTLLHKDESYGVTFIEPGGDDASPNSKEIP